LFRRLGGCGSGDGNESEVLDGFFLPTEEELERKCRRVYEVGAVKCGGKHSRESSKRFM
jgi:hypothetical protein